MEQPKIKKKKATINYVDNIRLYQEMILYKQAWVTTEGKVGVNNYIGKSIQDIAEHLATLPKFNGYSYISEMISDGIENVLRYIHNFDTEKYDNPLAYITQIVYYAFLRRIASEKKEQYIKYKLTASYGMYNEIVSGDFDKNIEVFDNISDFIELFESKKKEKDAKKVKPPSKKKGLEIYVESEDSELI